jgi:four helix bundle protein
MSFVKLIVFQKSYALAMDVFKLSKHFPKEETFALTDQIRRSSRSVCANIAEGYRKKVYPKSFVAKMVDADGECSETTVHLMFARDCGYISEETFNGLMNRYDEVGRMLGHIIKNPENILNF